MTVKEAASVLKRSTKIDLVWNNDSISFDKDNPLMMDAYGKYVVGEIMAVDDEGHYEVCIAMMPVKEGV